MQIKILSAAAVLMFAVSAQAAEHEVTQKDLNFNVKKLTVKVGDVVIFKNEDAVIHSIFSGSDTKVFDLEAAPKGKANRVTFDKAGVVEVECAIHPRMKMTVWVTH